jgi:hypothetical protein
VRLALDPEWCALEPVGGADLVDVLCAFDDNANVVWIAEGCPNDFGRWSGCEAFDTFENSVCDVFGLNLVGENLAF